MLLHHSDFRLAHWLQSVHCSCHHMANVPSISLTETLQRYRHLDHWSLTFLREPLDRQELFPQRIPQGQPGVSYFPKGLWFFLVDRGILELEIQVATGYGSDSWRGPEMPGPSNICAFSVSGRNLASIILNVFTYLLNPPGWLGSDARPLFLLSNAWALLAPPLLVISRVGHGPPCKGHSVCHQILGLVRSRHNK